ncbi:hypothetical protein N7466_001820 [Penicillium verhagenii]|uniref:uncharacterized protein n=1 Tax=Penicillium verhagenii TaxID=1562060 RepID=UPI00254523F8|nr:uncharacterized protein N7466_001820 [Penicillium verhagenii]KAJ5938686.1 hypothetical protein N7466_001820 [Penicillium verhagenii]
MESISGPSKDAQREPGSSAEESKARSEEEPIVWQEIKITRLAPEKWRKVKKEKTVDTHQSVLLTATRGNGSTISEAKRVKNQSIAINPSPEASNQIFKPYRLAINSIFLLRILEECTEITFREAQNVLVRPFKCLVEFESEIREALEKAELQSAEADATIGHLLHESDDSKIRIHGTATSERIEQGPIEQGPKNRNELAILKARERDELRCLVEFMDTDMKDIFDMKRRIKSESVDQIAFEHLWLFFKPGDLTSLCPDNDASRRQAFRILSVTGGRVCFDKSRKSSFDPVKDRNWDSDSENDEKVCDSVRFSGAERTNFIIDAFYLDSDGYAIAPRAKRFVVSPYSGERSVFSLPLRHFDFEAEKLQIQKDLLTRGSRFLELVSRKHNMHSTHTMYSGSTIQESNFVSSRYKNWKINSTEIHGEIIIDQEAALQHFKETYYYFSFRAGGAILTSPTAMDMRECVDFLAFDGDIVITDVFDDSVFEQARYQVFLDSTNQLNSRSIATNAFSDEDLLLLPPRVYGYSLLDHRWAAFNINFLKDLIASRGKDGWAKIEDLVLPENHKTILQALVTNQFQQSALEFTGDRGPQNQFSMDVVPAKGKGLIILLHGAPGVGKTSTAECIAAKLKRPILPITCGDIGTNATDAENNLESFCNLADRWRCVLLLDEADVFLAKRERGDIKRNSLVSVFLRVLEYFSGVIILTTNRVGEFDEAFRSRIHICLYYPQLGKGEVKQIWQKNLQRLKSGPLNIDIEEKEIEKFADDLWQRNAHKPSRRWNGRQIKNAFQTAIALANWEYQESGAKKRPRPILRVRHFRKVAKLAAHFDDYISEIYDLPDVDTYGELARRSEIRKDSSSPRKQFKNPRDGSRADHRRSTRRRSIDQDSLSGSDDSFGSNSEAMDPEDNRSQEEDDESCSDDDSDKIKELEMELKLKKMKEKRKAKRHNK